MTPRDRIDAVRAAHRAAENAYRRSTRQTGHGHAPTRNAKAEGLAEALAILEGVDVVEVRARVRDELDREHGDGMTGVSAARAALAAGAVAEVAKGMGGSRFDVC